MSIQWLRTSSMVWMVLCGGLYGCAAADEGLGQRVDRLDRAATPDEVMRAREAILRVIDSGNLKDLTSHDSVQVSLFAAWHELLVAEAKSTYRRGLDVATVQRFCGFLEGRLRVRVPKWWEDTMQSAEVFPSSPPRFTAPDWLTRYRRTGIEIATPQRQFTLTVNEQPELAGTSTELRIPRNIEVRVVKEAIILTIAGKSKSVPLSLLTDRYQEQLDAVFDDDKCYLAMQSDNGSRFELIRLDPVGSIAWTSTVWSANSTRSHGYSYQRVELLVDRERIIVFGAEPYTLFVEGFAKNDGTNLFRFATRYYTDEQ